MRGSDSLHNSTWSPSVRRKKAGAKRLSAALKMERYKRRLTQGEMADLIGCSRRSYAGWEAASNDPAIYYARRIEEEFDWPVGTIEELTRKRLQTGGYPK